MKLFTPIEVNKEKENLLQIGLKRTKDLDGELTRKRKELDKLNLEFETSMQRNAIQQEKEKSDFISLINDLKVEVNSLEKRKKETLVPINEKWKELEKIQLKLKRKEIDLQEKLEIFDDNLEALQDKLTSVAEREQNGKELAINLFSRQQGIELQRESIEKQQKLLNDKLAKSNIDFINRNKVISKKESEVNLKIKSIEYREQEIKRKEKSFINREKHIESQQNALKIASQELENYAKRPK